MIENVVDVEGVIGWEVTARGVKRQLADMGDVDVINVNINSPGGYIDDGFGIYTALKNHPADVNIHITGMAASMASVIAMAGDSVTIEPTGMYMIHPPSNIVWGTAVDMRKGADVLDKYEARLVKAYTRRGLNISDAELSDAIAEETWYTADEVVEAGFVDSVAEGDSGAMISEDSGASALAWMKVAAFKNAPEDIAENFGFYKTTRINNAATKSMVKALAKDGSAVETPTEGKQMTDEKTYSEAELQAEIKKAKAEAKADSKENEVGAEAAQALASMLADDNATIERVRAAAEMGLDAEQASKFMAHMASEAGSAAKATVNVEGSEESKAMSSADLLKQITALANRDLDAVNKNASSAGEYEDSPKQFDAKSEYASLKGDM